MKKISLILLALTMLLLSACGSVGSFVDEEVQELKEIFGAKTEEVWTEEMAEEIAEAEEDFEPFSEEGLYDPAETIDLEDIFEDEDVFYEDDDFFEEEPSRPATDAPTSEGFEVITVADDEQCTLKITGIHPDTIWGFTIDLYIENNTKRSELSFNLDSAYVNSLRCYPSFYPDVSAGEAVSETLYLSDEVLLESGIEEITKIDLAFSAYDYNDWNAEDIGPMPVTIYPQGEENAVRYAREPQESDLVLFENEDLSARIIGFEPDPGWSYDAIIYLENRAEKDLEIAIDSMTVNGFPADSFFYETVAAGTGTYVRLQWYAEFFEQYGIEKLEEIGGFVQIFDAQEYDLLAEEDLVLTLE